MYGLLNADIFPQISLDEAFKTPSSSSAVYDFADEINPKGVRAKPTTSASPDAKNPDNRPRVPSAYDFVLPKYVFLT